MGCLAKGYNEQGYYTEARSVCEFALAHLGEWASADAPEYAVDRTGPSPRAYPQGFGENSAGRFAGGERRGRTAGSQDVAAARTSRPTAAIGAP